MKTLRLPKSLFAAALSLLFSSALVADVWVAENGNDSATGTSDDPLASIAAAVAALGSGGGTVHLKPGTYTNSGTITLSDAIVISGETGNPADVTVNENQSAGCSIFKLNHANARIEHITVENGGGGSSSNGVSGGNVYIDTNGGSVVHCVLKGGDSSAKYGTQGGNVYMKAGLVSRCVIQNGKSEYRSGGGNVYMSGGTVEQCLITGGKSSGTLGGGVRINKGLLANCTIAGNSGTTSSGVYVGASNDTDARVVNCVIVDNAYTAFDWNYANVCGPTARAASFDHCMTDGVEQPNATCVGYPFGFADRNAKDYHLTGASSAWNAGVAVADLSAVDLDGSLRTQGSAIDLGCYELDDTTPSIGFDATPRECLAPLTVTFNAGTTGGTPDSYHWDFGDGTTDDTASDTVSHTYTTAGKFTVAVSATVSGTPVSCSHASFIAVIPAALYVDPNCATPTYPYDTLETAAKTLAVALAEAGDGTTIYLVDGIHKSTAVSSLSKAVTVRSLSGDPSACMVSNAVSRTRTFYLNNANAWVRDITIAKGESYQCNGGNVFIDALGGCVSNCIITAGTADNYSGTGGNVGMTSDGGLITHCQILKGVVNNTGGGSKGGNVTMSKGRLEHSLVAYGKDTSNGSNASVTPGIYVSGGTVLHCTIAGNEGKTTGGIYAGSASAVVKNCVIAGNTSSVTGGDAAAWGGQAAAFVNCYSDTSAAINENCFTATAAALLKDIANGDCTAAPASPIIDAGGTVADLPGVDLAGNPRVQGNAVDIGCYEAEAGVFSATFDADVTSGILPVTVVFTATTDGAGENDVLSYAWDFGDGTSETTSTNAVAHTYTTGGVLTVSLVVTDVTAGKTADPATRTDFLQFAPRILYVDQACEAPAAPYGTWATAATKVQDAINAAVDGCEIIVRAARYADGARILVEKSVHLHSETGSPEDVILARKSGVDHAILFVSAHGALVDGFAIEGGHANGYAGAGISYGILGGCVSNCVIRNCYGWNWSGENSAVSSTYSTALTTHCVITNNTLASDNGGGSKAIVGISSGRLENCLVKDNYSGSAETDPVCLLSVGSAGVVVNCTFVGNTMINRGLVRIDSTSGGAVTNCVFADNTFPATGSTGGFCYSAADAAQHFTYCATDLAEPLNESCVVGTVATFFKDYAKGDCTPNQKGPLYNAGVTPENAPSVDLAGNPRVKGRSIDIGCFESSECSFIIIIR